MKDLSSLTKEELEEFFSSFDFIFSDVDGVLFNVLTPIPNTAEAVKSLRKIGKKIVFCTNNTIRPLESLAEKLNKAGFEVTKDDLLNPIQVLVSHLSTRNLKKKKLFVLGMAPMKNALKDAGFEIVDNTPTIEEDILNLVASITNDDTSIGAVISDLDMNLNYMNLQKAITYLRRPEVEFYKGAEDDLVPVSGSLTVLGPGYFHKALEKMSKRTATAVAKKSAVMKEYIEQNYDIDPKRVLFIGDNVCEDITCGKLYGYKTLLMLSGTTSSKCIEDWTFDTNLKPDFYAEHLGIVKDLIEKISKN